jgi:hypothetical protein
VQVRRYASRSGLRCRGAAQVLRKRAPIAPVVLRCQPCLSWLSCLTDLSVAI